MKIIVKSKDTLKNIKYLPFFSFILSGFIFSYSHTRILGVILVIVTVITEWRLYRCPHCNASLDTRINLDKNKHCPHCGKEI